MPKQTKDMRRKILLISLVLILVLGLAGCKAKGPATVAYMPLEYIPEPVSIPALPAGNGACPSAEPLASGKSFNIIWWVPDILPNLDAVVREFESENPQIQVTLQVILMNDYRNAITAVLASGCNAPDLVTLPVGDSAYYASYGWLASLWNQYTFDEKEDWIQALRKSGRYAREQYTAPLNTSVSLLFYNSNIFADFNITPPTEGERWTWEKVADVARDLTKEGVEGGSRELWGLAFANTSAQNFVSLPQSLGGEAIGLDGVTVKGILDTQPWQDAFSFYAKLFTVWKVSPVDDSFDAEAAFTSGKLAMLIAPAADIEKFASADISWSVAPYPYFAKGKLVLPSGDWQIGVNAQSTQRDAAMIVIHWLTYKVGGEALWREGNVFLPAEKNVLNLFATEPAFETAPKSYWKTAAKEALIFTLPGPITPFYHDYDLQLQNALRDLRQGADPKTTLIHLVDTLSGLMK